MGKCSTGKNELTCQISKNDKQRGKYSRKIAYWKLNRRKSVEMGKNDEVVTCCIINDNTCVYITAVAIGKWIKMERLR